MRENVDLILMFLGAALGSLRASIEFDRDKTCALRFFDVVLGVFVGVMVASHYGSEFNLWLTSLIALIGGVSGAMVIDVFVQMLPDLAKTAIKKLAEKLKA